MSLKARLVKINGVKVIDGHVVYDETITHEVIFDFNYDMNISNVGNCGSLLFASATINQRL